MNILCLNTAFNEAHIALFYNGNEYFRTNDANSKHSENLLVSVEQLFETISKENSSNFLNEIDALAVVVGPGSFTGLRISIATAKAILSTHPTMKAIAINSLELIASQSKEKNKTAILDALSGLYFVSSFEEQKETISPMMITEKELEQFSNFVSIENLPFETEKIVLSPKSLLEMAKQKAKEEKFIKENELVPLYIRPSQAEANLNGTK